MPFRQFIPQKVTMWYHSRFFFVCLFLQHNNATIKDAKDFFFKSQIPIKINADEKQNNNNETE